MPKDKDASPDGSGDPGSEKDGDQNAGGGGQDPGKNPDKDGDGSGGDGGGGKGKDDTTPAADKPVSPTVLQNILNAEKRRQTEEMKKLAKQNDKLAATLEALTKRLDKQTGGDGDGKDDKSKDSDTELAELRRQIDQLTAAKAESDARAQSEQQARLDQAFRTEVTSQLISAGCEKPEEAFLVIKPRLTHDAEKNSIYATVNSDYGPQELDLKTYIERHFKEEILPHVFKGKMVTGAPNGGDSGGGGYQMTREQALDAEAYAKDPEKFRKAIEEGRVKGIKRGQPT